MMLIAIVILCMPGQTAPQYVPQKKFNVERILGTYLMQVLLECAFDVSVSCVFRASVFSSRASCWMFLHVHQGKKRNIINLFAHTHAMQMRYDESAKTATNEILR